MATFARAYGSKLYVEVPDATTGTPKLVEIAPIENVKPPEASVDKVEFTPLSGDGFKQSIPGIADPGEVTLTIAWDGDGANISLLKSLSDERSVNKWVIKIGGTGKQIEFNGWIQKFSFSELKGDELVKVELTISVTGGWNITTAV